MVLLPHLLNTAAEQYCGSTNGYRTGTSGGIVYWPEAVQYLLCLYATDTAICEALNDFREVRKSPTENGTAYAARRNRAASLCVNMHDEEEK